jgi:hypothetical protein
LRAEHFIDLGLEFEEGPLAGGQRLAVKDRLVAVGTPPTQRLDGHLLVPVDQHVIVEVEQGLARVIELAKAKEALGAARSIVHLGAHRGAAEDMSCNRPDLLMILVGASGFEPPTPTVSTLVGTLLVGIELRERREFR